MTDNANNRKVVRDGNFTSLSSFQYQDIKEGTVELSSFEQPTSRIKNSIKNNCENDFIFTPFYCET